MKYEQLSKDIIDLVGGEKNVLSLYHCMTRGRFKLKDMKKANKKELGNIDGVISVIESSGQLQVVIGNYVEDVFKSIMSIYNIQGASSEKQDGQKEKGNIVARLFNVMSSIFTPIIPILAGSGMLKALLVILTTYAGMDKLSGTYKILASSGNAVFYFFPIFIAFSAAKAFGVNQYISAAIMGALIEPNFTSLMEATGDVTHFLNIPVVLMSYTSTVIPAILVIWIFSYLEKFLKRVIPKNIELFTISFISILIMVPLTATVIGPLGVSLGNGLGSVITFMSDKSGFLTGAIIGGSWTFLVMFGIHWGVVPIMLNNLALYGYDTIRPAIATATFAQAGAAFGVFLKSKNPKTKSFAISAMLPALLGGITEPIIYGISVKYKKPMYAAVIAGGLAGGFVGAMKTTVMVYVFPALTTLPAFMTNTFWYYIIGITLAFFLTTALTYFFGIDEEKETAVNGVVENKQNTKSQICDGIQQYEIMVPVNGTAIPLEDVDDSVFSTGIIGKGMAIIPTEGKVFAPVDGVVTALFPTKHAIGIIANDGTEIMIHVGIDTVHLEGKFFEAKIKQGDEVKKGQLILNFEMDKIKEAGYDVTTMVIVTNSEKYLDVLETEETVVTKDQVLITAIK
ncbi:MAG: beta-glucoside-specific PTS transporter subunit IIABC [Clostridiaceae bacterium]|nr:beta-glucoside-specific PTS transporter subunit IIABC [Clostridiaceae bacterium]